MDAPARSIRPEPQAETLMISFRIISRRSWDDLQGWHEAFPREPHRARPVRDLSWLITSRPAAQEGSPSERPDRIPKRLPTTCVEGESYKASSAPDPRARLW